MREMFEVLLYFAGGLVPLFNEKGIKLDVPSINYDQTVLSHSLKHIGLPISLRLPLKTNRASVGSLK